MAQTSNTMITVEELKTVLSSLKRSRDTIYSTYNSDIKKVLENSNSCLAVAGLDTTAINNAFSSTFNNINQNLNGLINVLENDVISGYSDLAVALRQMFGRKFAAELSQLLDIYQRN